MRRAYKFLLRPTARQRAALEACLEDTRQLYNAALEESWMPYSKTEQQRIDAGLCKDCGNPRAEDGTVIFCRPCADRHNQRQSARTSALRAAGSLITPETRERNRGYGLARIQRHRDAGLCLDCGTPNPTVGDRYPLCLDCWFQGIAKKRGGSRRNGPVIKAIFEEQQGRCAYTGELLVPGATASLDHKIPMSRGGRHDKANLQWVTGRINSMKADLTHEEFVALCGVIASSGLALQANAA